jgi:hypothetical protein
MRIQEMCYELRNLARKEEDLPKKDLYYQSAKALETLSNMVKMGDLIVAEMEICKKNPDKCRACDWQSETPKEWPISEEPIKMIDDFIKELAVFQYIDLKTRHGVEDDYRYWHDKREYKE